MVHFEVKNLSFSYAGTADKEALSEIDLKIEQGEYITLCGKSGCGKTTLLKQFKSVLTPHGKREGEVLFRGIPLAEIGDKIQAAKIGYVMQNPDHQIVTDKVWHELAFGLENIGMDQKTIRLRVAEMASYFGIESWFYKNVTELSGGQKQLLNLASIMAMQPEILILDEPTSQLDPIAASDFLNTIRKINRELRTTILITEHRLEDIFYTSDRVVVMEEGKIIQEDEPRKIGAYLKENKNPMFAFMPTPVQIYYGVPNQLQCPLTVREGGEWLQILLGDKELQITESESIQEGEKFHKTETAIEMKDVWFRYERKGNDVLKGVEMKVPRGCIYAIMGGNGTGKSTLLKSLCHICKPYRGNIRMREKFAMLPQDPQSLFVKQSVREELEEMLSNQVPRERIQEMAELCEISHVFDAHPYDLSGGEQQRVALAKVLLANPGILLLDEPTKGMDGIFKIKFAEILSQLKEQGMTIVMVSHDVEFCAKYTDYVSMFFDGGILATNTPNGFFAKNSFYTTAASRMSRHIFPDAVTDEEVITLCQKNII